MSGKIGAVLKRFAAREEGVAAVEFALIFPFLLALYLGSIEAAALFTADKRVNTISSTIGDLIAQWNPGEGAISSDTLNMYFDASEGIISPYPDVGVEQVVSLIFVKSDGTTVVRWSRQSGGGTVWPEGKPYTPLAATTETNQVARGGCIVAAETSYSYKPLLGVVFTQAINLRHTNYFIPRYGATAEIDLTDKTLAATACDSDP